MNCFNLLVFISMSLLIPNFVNGQSATTQIHQIQQSNRKQEVNMKQLGDKNEALVIQQLELINASNNTQIAQFGDGNIAQLETKGNDNQAQVEQHGEENFFLGRVAGNGTEIVLFQQGTKNKLIQNVEPENQVPIVVIQDGFSNEAEINLETSGRFSEPIQVIQKGIAPKVIIRN